MKSEEYMNRKQQEAGRREIEVSILFITIIINNIDNSLISPMSNVTAREMRVKHLPELLRSHMEYTRCFIFTQGHEIMYLITT